MRPTVCMTKALLCAVLALTFTSAQALEHAYFEDFATKDYCDESNTTALWDTSAGELRLPPFELSHLGSVVTPGSPYELVVRGDHAYVADYTSGLTVVDVSDPSSPAIVGALVLPGASRGIDVAGDRAYVAAYSSGLRVVDVSDQTAPVEVAYCDTLGAAYEVAVAGHYAYVAAGSAGLRVVTVGGAAPYVVGTYDTGGSARCVDVKGDHAYVADYSVGLVVVDISNPTSPALAGGVSTSGFANGVMVDGDYAFVGCMSGGVDVVDVSDPANPVVAANYDTPSSVQRLFVDGDHVYAADNSSLQVIDVQDPTQPAFEASFATSGGTRAVAVSGMTAFLLSSTTDFDAVSIGTWIAPSFEGSAPCGEAYVGDVCGQGDYVYVSAQHDGLGIYDVSLPSEPVLVGVYDPTGEDVNAADVDGDLAVVARDTDVHVVDVSDPEAPSLLGSCSTITSEIHNVAISGDFAFATMGLEGVSVVDISDPTSPFIADDIQVVGAVALGLDAAGDYLAVAAKYDFLMFKVLETGTISLVGSCATGSYTTDVDLEGNYAFVSASDRLLTIDVSDPTSPSVVSSIEVDMGWFEDVEVFGDRLYLADECGSTVGGIRVYDVSDPESPVLIDGYESGQNTSGMVRLGDFLLVACLYDSVRAFQISDREAYVESDEARSLDVESSDIDIVRARMTANTSGGIAVPYCSNDGGSSWQEADLGDWLTFPSQDDDLRWRLRLDASPAYDKPVVGDLTVEWGYRFALIDAVADVGNDQGGQVSLEWSGSGHDQAATTHTITDYLVYRRIDAPERGEEPADVPVARSVSRASAVEEAGGSGPPPSLGRYPPGDWHYVTTVPAFGEDEYAVVVPTLVDSTAGNGVRYSVFFVRALTDTPGVYFDSPPDSGYSVDNLEPHVPTGLRVDHRSDRNELAWDAPLDPDFDHFRVYRGACPDFAPDAENLIAEVVACAWTDEVQQGWGYHYKVSSVDRAGNESEAASPEETTGVPDGATPTRYALYQNVPNPFNPTTTLRFDVPEPGGGLKLEIFNASGRSVTVLLEDEFPAGPHWTTWDGRDAAGERVASGVYFYRLTAPGFERTRRMIVLK